MNVTRLQQDILKDVLADKAGKWFVQCTDAEAIIFTEHQIWLMDQKDFLFNYGKLVDAGVKQSTATDYILNKADDADIAVKTGQLRQADKRTLIEFKVNEELIYLDQALLKYYDKSAEYYGINAKSPVFIYEDDILVGCVLPVKVGE